MKIGDEVIITENRVSLDRIGAAHGAGCRGIIIGFDGSTANEPQVLYTTRQGHVSRLFIYPKHVRRAPAIACREHVWDRVYDLVYSAVHRCRICGSFTLW